MFLNIKKPTLQKVSVPVEKKSPTAKPSTPKLSTPVAAVQRTHSPASSTNGGRRSLTPSTLARKATARASANGNGSSLKVPSKRTLEASPKRRKPASPATPQFESSDSEDVDDESSMSDASGARKRRKLEDEVVDTTRELRDATDWEKEGRELPGFIHGKKLSRGNTKEFKTAFLEVPDEEPAQVKLGWPSGAPSERFELVIPNDDDDGYKPLDDIIQTVEQTLLNFFPSPQSTTLTDDSTGFPRRLKRAIHHQSLKDFKAVLTEYNATLKTTLASSSISSTLAAKHTLPLELIERILSQIYARTVSPHVETLKAYKNGTSNVYGEILPPLISRMLHVTRCDSRSVFLDLGSGVGNVTLQAALQTGAESWGIEQMPNPAHLASAQQLEFVARCRAWGVKVGAVRLLHGDFLLAPEIDSLMKRVDVIMVNNQAFGPDLNDALLMKFLDLKEGARIVSLKSFVPDNWQIRARSIEDPRNLLTVQRMEYFSGSVSWTDGGGEWFVATKDSSRLKRFMERNPSSRNSSSPYG